MCLTYGMLLTTNSCLQLCPNSRRWTHIKINPLNLKSETSSLLNEITPTKTFGPFYIFMPKQPVFREKVFVEEILQLRDFINRQNDTFARSVLKLLGVLSKSSFSHMQAALWMEISIGLSLDPLHRYRLIGIKIYMDLHGPP